MGGGFISARTLFVLKEIEIIKIMLDLLTCSLRFVLKEFEKGRMILGFIPGTKTSEVSKVLPCSLQFVLKYM